MRSPDGLAVKHRRPMQILVSMLGPAKVRAVNAAAKNGYDMSGLGLSYDDFALVMQLGDATIYALLESWTLDAPLPRSISEVTDMPGDVYDVLTVEAMRVNAEYAATLPKDPDTGDPIDPFGLAAVEDLTSPTGASVASKGPSTAVARRAPSDRKKPSGGRSTGTARRSA